MMMYEYDDDDVPVQYYEYDVWYDDDIMKNKYDDNDA